MFVLLKNLQLKLVPTHTFCFVISKEEVDSEVQTLLSLKGKYKQLTGEDLAGGGKRDKKGNKENKDTKKQSEQVKSEIKADNKEADDSSREVKKQTR